MIADNGLWRRNWPADPIGGRGALYTGGYEVQEAGLERRSTISHPRVGPHDLVSFLTGDDQIGLTLAEDLREIGML